MAYADTQSVQQRAAGIAGAAAAHAAIGGLIVLGLTVTVLIDEAVEDETITAIDVPTDIPPPPPAPDEPAQPDTPIADPVVTPVTDFPLPDPVVLNDTVAELPDLTGDIRQTIPTRPLPSPGPDLSAVQPVAAIPRGNPSRWITDSDYKPRWIREGLVGSATFRLEINAKGRVENCAITRSTGHSVLDQATCSLLAKRARFKPAKTSQGAATNGIYTSSIRWQLPD